MRKRSSIVEFVEKPMRRAWATNLRGSKCISWMARPRRRSCLVRLLKSSAHSWCVDGASCMTDVVVMKSDERYAEDIFRHGAP